MSYGSAGAFSGYSPQSGARRRSPPLWTPDQLSVLARYTADSLVLSNGASITSLTSTGGSGPTLTPRGASSLPTYVAADAALGGRPSMDFAAGTDTCLGTAVGPQVWLNRTDVCFLAVIAPASTLRQTIFGTENVSGPQWELNSAPGRMSIIVPGSFLLVGDHGTLATTCIYALSATGLTTAPTGISRADGLAGTTGTTATAPFSGDRAVIIGRRGVGNQQFRGRLADLTICPMLTQADIERYEGWAAHRYGKTAVLPGGHPYKTTPPYL